MLLVNQRRDKTMAIKFSPEIRPATERDLETINDIYNYYVVHSTCTYQEQLEPIESRQQWFEHHDEKHPVTVAIEEGQVIGWGSLSSYHPRSAYRLTVENSIYIDHRHHRRGVGSAILRDLIERAKSLGYHTMIAGADGEQAASIGLHTKFGFEKVGHLKQVGFKFNRWLDVIFMQLMLG